MALAKKQDVVRKSKSDESPDSVLLRRYAFGRVRAQMLRIPSSVQNFGEGFHFKHKIKVLSDA
jgi:hypothetical protein